ncbi:hypothetical protein EBS02_05375 [bacterium]|nr:hypothetical protein [bacterium]
MSEPKRALVLSGGGSNGSYQVGALQALAEHRRKWHSVHGISVGALNAAWIAMFPPDEQADNMHGLLNIWNNIHSTADIYTPWSSIKPINYLYSMRKGSLYSGAPLRALVQKFLDKQQIRHSKTLLTVGCVNLHSGEYVVIPGNHEQIGEYILASSHLPLIFEPIEIDGQKWVDGGIRHQVPILEALKERPDEIDVILTTPIATRERIGEEYNLLSAPRVALRASEIMSDQIYIMDCYTALRAAKTIENTKINIFIPSRIPNPDSMVFHKDSIKKAIICGYEETQKQLLQTLSIIDEDKKIFV